MKFFKPLLLLSLIISVSSSIFAQKVRNSLPSEKRGIYTEFTDFFEKEIKHQGIKGNWIFRLNEIIGLHKFDYNSDGSLDTLIEFSAISIEGEATTYRFAALFENYGGKNFRFVNFLKCNQRQFLKFEEGHFVFLQTTEVGETAQKYLLKKRKFLLIH